MKEWCLLKDSNIRGIASCCLLIHAYARWFSYSLNDWSCAAYVEVLH